MLTDSPGQRRGDLIERLERATITRAGREMAAATGDHVSRKLAGVANLAGGRFAMTDGGITIRLVPWQ